MEIILPLYPAVINVEVEKWLSNLALRLFAERKTGRKSNPGPPYKIDHAGEETWVCG
jgi:hypothetical protein